MYLHEAPDNPFEAELRGVVAKLLRRLFFRLTGTSKENCQKDFSTRKKNISPEKNSIDRWTGKNLLKRRKKHKSEGKKIALKIISFSEKKESFLRSQCRYFCFRTYNNMCKLRYAHSHMHACAQTFKPLCCGMQRPFILPL
jgi:hypothetical protein